MGRFSLRGFPQPEELFLRSLVEGNTEEYLKTIITSVNAEVPRLQGYRFVGRKITTEFVREFGVGKARPFLARELLNIPKLPYSRIDFADALLAAANHEEKEREFIGYFVDWEGTFQSFTRYDFEIDLSLRLRSPRSTADEYFLMTLMLPLINLETVKTLTKGQRLRARGVIHDIWLQRITLNYVDLEIVPESGVAKE